MEVSESVAGVATWVHSLLLSVGPASPGAFVLVFVLVFVATTMVGVPRTVLTLLAGSAFGPWSGAGIAWGAALLAAVGSYEVGHLASRRPRTGGRVDRLLTRAEEAVAAAARDRSGGARAGWLAVMVSLRLVPVLPFGIVNYGSGVVGVPRGAFAAGSALGLVPGAVLYAALGGGLSAPGWVPTLLAALAVAALAGLAAARWGGRPRALDSRRRPEHHRE